MKCPHCNIALVMTDRSGIEIDYCPQCRGVWLDRGELDKIIERSAPGAGAPLPPLVADPAAPAPGAPRYDDPYGQGYDQPYGQGPGQGYDPRYDDRRYDNGRDDIGGYDNGRFDDRRDDDRPEYEHREDNRRNSRFDVATAGAGAWAASPSWPARSRWPRCWWRGTGWPWCRRPSAKCCRKAC